MSSLRIIHVESASTFGGQEGRIFKEMLAKRDRGRFDVLNTHSRRDTVIAAVAGRLAQNMETLYYRWLAERRV